MEELAKNQGNLRPLIIGLGRSGLALGNHLARHGIPFFIYDDRGEAAFSACLTRWPGSTWWRATEALSSISEILLSPGVPLTHLVMVAASGAGIPVRSELEVAFGETQVPVIAITGTNGKSTTTALVEHFLVRAGQKAKACGNFGIPLLEVIESDPIWDAFVVEVSSFQSETSPSFKPKYAALLNLTPDHLDRYPTLAAYAAAKAKSVAAQDAQDHLVYNADALAFAPIVRASKATCWPFSSAKRLDRGAFLRDGQVVVRLGKDEDSISLVHNPLVGLHHLENILAAVLLARLYGISAVDIEAALPSFKGLPHRLEKVGEIAGVAFYDDSKATNVGAMAMSLASFDTKVVLIAGGRDKEGDFESIAALVTAKVATVMLIGEASDKIERAWQDRVPLVRAGDMETAVTQAFDLATAHRYPVVLAPGCASFDQFKDYKHRGDVFQKLVHELNTERAVEC